MYSFFCLANLSRGNYNTELKLSDLCLQSCNIIIVTLRDGHESMSWNQQTNCNRFVSNNSPIVPSLPGILVYRNVSKAPDSLRDMTLTPITISNQENSMKWIARLLPMPNTELADNKYSWGSLTLSVLDSIPTNAIDFRTGSTILGYLAFFSNVTLIKHMVHHCFYTKR